MRILGLGDHVIDVYRNRAQAYPGGNALNVAVNAALLQHESAYMGVFGEDVFSNFLIRFLKEHHVDLSLCERKQHATTKCCIEDIWEGERQFSHVELGKAWAGVIELREDHIKKIADFDVIFTGCNAKLEQQLPKLRTYKGLLIYDFGEKEKYRQGDYMELILPYADIIQLSMSDMPLEAICSWVSTLSYDGIILITRGGEATLCFQAGRMLSYAQTPVIPVDTMGAGDACITAFVCSLWRAGYRKHMLADDLMMQQALKDGCAYAAEVCRIPGGFDCPYDGLRAVIFDMDGVLVDSEPAWQRIFAEFLHAHGKQLKEKDKARLYGCSKTEEDRILASYFDEPIEVVHQYKEHYIKEHPFSYRDCLIDGVNDVLAFLQEQQITLALASSSPMKDIERMLQECELASYFSLIVSGEMFQESKPNPEIYQYCIKALSIHPASILVVENSAYGIAAASSAGLSIIRYRQEHQAVPQENIRMVCHSHQEIKEYIMKQLHQEAIDAHR